MDSYFEGEAQLDYKSSDFEMILPGSYVICAVTGERISLDRLRYWSAERQEAYVDAAASLAAWKKANA